MSAPAADAARYIYGVVRADRTGPGAVPAGIAGGPVHRVTVGAIAALCSPVDGRPVRPSRANVTAHQSVVEAAHSAGPVLPVRFGTVVPDEAAVVSEMLEPAEAQLRAGLSLVEGHDEFRVRASYRPDVALSEVLGSDRQVARLRDRLRTRPGGGSPGERIELGELVAAALERHRDADNEAFRSAVAATSAAAADLGPRRPDEAVHWALVVARSARSDIDATLADWADREADRMTVSVVGPLPPWDFADHLTSGHLTSGHLKSGQLTGSATWVS